MIRMITENDIPILKTMCREDVFISRILSTYTAYGGTNVADFWVQTEDGKLNTVLCLIDDVLTLSHVSDGNMDELAGFLYAVEARTILSDASFVDEHCDSSASTGPILLYDNSEMLEFDLPFDRNPPLKELYQVMKVCESDHFAVPPWEPFYLDMSHRIRHNCALSVGIRNEDGQMCGCGFTVAQTEHNAVLGGICVLPTERRKGYGKMVVAALLSQLPQSDIYVFRDVSENKDFYDIIGFQEVGSWAEIHR